MMDPVPGDRMRDIGPLPLPQTEPEPLDRTWQFDETDRRQLLKQGILHYSGQIANVISSVVLVPIMLLKLGAEAYGFWIVALAAPAFLAGLDNAFCLSVTRETAANRGVDRVEDQATTRFLTACFGAFSFVGLAGGVFTIIAATGVIQRLHLDPSLRVQARFVIVAVAVAFAAGRASVFGSSVLAGFNRFGTINAISVGALVCRFTGFFVLLERHASLSAISLWYCLIALIEAAIEVGIAYRLGALRVDRTLLDWAQLRRAGSFGIWSFLTTEVLNLGTFAPAFLLGLLTGGTAATTTLYTGQRPGLIISEFNWRGGDILFAASASKSEQNQKTVGPAMMAFGTGSVLAIALPLCSGMVILAPAIVSVWLHVNQPEIVTVMRLTAVGILADALLVSPMHILWGRGMARTVLVISSGITCSILLMNFLLIRSMGATGSAIAFSAATWFGAFAITIVASRELKAPFVQSMLTPFLRVLVPAALMAVCTQWLSVSMRENPRLLLVTAVGCGCILYIAAFALQELIRRKYRIRSQQRPT
jgi:O-antigen/teichoic acid export membrane protein